MKKKRKTKRRAKIAPGVWDTTYEGSLRPRRRARKKA